MKHITSLANLKETLSNIRMTGKTLGFVPTMGALHLGHISLLERAKAENDLSFCSIFVNPIQFNEQNDYDAYPRELEKDLSALAKNGCDYVFTPSVKEMYPVAVKEEYDFGEMDKVMEGAYRPGHFNGVAQVLSRFFELIPADRAYFGEKDFQQLAIVKQLVKKKNYKVEIIGCPIVRENNGLAMSSRNMRLSEKQRKEAAIIYRCLQNVKQRMNMEEPLKLKKEVIRDLEKENNLQVEYFEIADANTLQPVKNWDDTPEMVVCVAVRIGGVRLIDNIRLFN